MTAQEYTMYVVQALNNEELNFVYKSPKIHLSDDGVFTVLNRRLSSFTFEGKGGQALFTFNYRLGLSPQDLVSAMGIQRGSLYVVFGSKQQLFF